MPVLARALVITVASSVIAPAESFCATMASSSPSSSAASSADYLLREYDPTSETDKASLDEICRNVYGGGDYLPSLAETYAGDGACSFLALEDASASRLAAVANYKRLPAQDAAWIEAVRTHKDYRGQGLASSLLRSMIDIAASEDENNGGRRTSVLTCTVSSNKPMKKALEKTGFEVVNRIHCLAFSSLKELGGWASESEGEPEPLLDALGLRESVSAEAREASGSWRTVSTERELLSCLRRCREVGGSSGYLPGLYEFIVPGPGRLDLSRSLDDGLVFVLDCPDVDKEQSSCSSPEGQVGPALLAFTRDGRISSLKSNWVCSVVASSRVSFESAIDYAHSSDVADKLNTGTARKNTPPFCLVFDDRVPIEEGTLAERLPRVEDECVVFSYIQKKE